MPPFTRALGWAEKGADRRDRSSDSAQPTAQTEQRARCGGLRFRVEPAWMALQRVGESIRRNINVPSCVAIQGGDGHWMLWCCGGQDDAWTRVVRALRAAKRAPLQAEPPAVPVSSAPARGQ